MRHFAVAFVLAWLAGCATQAPAPADSAPAIPPSTGPVAGPPPGAARAPAPKSADCREEVARLQARLASETAERQRLLRAASKREETLRKQLDAMKSIERGILEREERTK